MSSIRIIARGEISIYLEHWQALCGRKVNIILGNVYIAKYVFYY